jgi:hypothetical protein
MKANKLEEALKSAEAQIQSAYASDRTKAMQRASAESVNRILNNGRNSMNQFDDSSKAYRAGTMMNEGSSRLEETGLEAQITAAERDLAVLRRAHDQKHALENILHNIKTGDETTALEVSMQLTNDQSLGAGASVFVNDLIAMEQLIEAALTACNGIIEDLTDKYFSVLV